MKTKQFFTALFFAILYTGLHAQEPGLPKLKEYGIGFAGLSNYSLQYRWGTEKKLYRVMGSITANSAFGNTRFSSSSAVGGSVFTSQANTKMPVASVFGLGFSILHLKPVVNNFGIFYGPSFGLSGQYSNSPVLSPIYQIESNGNISTNSSKTTFFSAGASIGFSLGAYYKVSDQFLVYAELSPGLFYRYNYQKTESTHYVSNATSLDYVTVKANNDSHSFGFTNIGNSNAMITLAYRLSK